MNIKTTSITTAIFLTLFLISTQTIKAQLTIDTTLTPTQMVQNLVGDSYTIDNVTTSAATGSYAYYYSENTELGNSEGILLTTGKAIRAIGPNNSKGMPLLDELNNCLNCDDYDNHFKGDELSNAVFGITSWDACVFEFDIIAIGNSFSFEYIFASEEYSEWRGTSFDDVFGLFITGSGLADVNLATIPGTTDRISIQTINSVVNTSYFYDNTTPHGNYVQYDGFTTNLSASINGYLISGATYHIKMVIADVADRIYDSAVFISKIQDDIPPE